jgi:hypothetical protein
LSHEVVRTVSGFCKPAYEYVDAWKTSENREITGLGVAIVTLLAAWLLADNTITTHDNTITNAVSAPNSPECSIHVDTNVGHVCGVATPPKFDIAVFAAPVSVKLHACIYLFAFLSMNSS